MEEQEVLVFVDANLAVQVTDRNVLEDAAGFDIPQYVQAKLIEQGVIHDVQEDAFVGLLEEPVLDSL